MTEQGLDVSQAEALLEEVGREAVAQRMDRDLFFTPQSASIKRTALCALPGSMWVVARRICSADPATLGNSRTGFRWLDQSARKPRQVILGIGTKRSLWPLPRRMWT